MSTLPLGLIVPDGREAAFFYSLAVGKFLPHTKHFQILLTNSLLACTLSQRRSHLYPPMAYVITSRAK